MKRIIRTVILTISLLALFAGCAAEVAPEVELAEFNSDYGYSVMYPADLTPTSLSSNIDFVVMDEKTATTVSIEILEKLDSFSSLTEDDFVDEFIKEDLDIKIFSFEHTTINGMDAIIAKYPYKESEVTNIVYNAPDHLYHASYTELPGTSGKVREEFGAIIYSLEA